MAVRRVLILDAKTLEILDSQAPASAVSVTRALNGPGNVSLSLPAAYNAKRDAAGHPWLLERGTVVVVEDTSQRLTAGLVDKVSLKADVVEVSAGGISMTATGAPWDGPARSWISLDALHAWRHIWSHLRTQPDALPMEVTGDTSCGVTIGRPESARYRDVRLRIEDQQAIVGHAQRGQAAMELKMTNAARILYAVDNRKKIGEIRVGESAPSGEGKDAECYIRTGPDGRGLVAVHFWGRLGPGQMGWKTYQGEAPKGRATAWLGYRNQRDAAKEREDAAQAIITPLEQYIRDNLAHSHAEPYELNWWSSHDLSRDLEEIRDMGGFDWWETARWSGDRIVLGVQARKRAGAVKDNLSFQLGVNVHTHPELTRGDIRTDLQVFGEGEGSAMLTADRRLKHSRLVRTPLVVSAKDARTQQVVNRAADRALADARAALKYRVHELVVNDTDFAPHGSFDLGDTIPLLGDIADGTRLSLMVRVISITDNGAGPLNLEVETV